MAVSAALRSIDRLKAKCRAIHVARRQLDLDDASYRALLKRAAGVTSSADLGTLAKADAVLDALSKLGFAHKPKITARGRVEPGKRPGTPHNLEREPLLQKVEALLADMALPWSYAEAIAWRQTKQAGGIERLAWVPDAALAGVIAALHTEKKKRLVKVMAEMSQALAARGLTAEWARQQAEDMGRLAQPWRWYECLDTLRLIAARLSKQKAS